MTSASKDKAPAGTFDETEPIKKFTDSDGRLVSLPPDLDRGLTTALTFLNSTTLAETPMLHKQLHAIPGLLVELAPYSWTTRQSTDIRTLVKLYADRLFEFENEEKEKTLRKFQYFLDAPPTNHEGIKNVQAILFYAALILFLLLIPKMT